MSNTISAPTGGVPVVDDVRKARLGQAVDQEVSAGGWVEARDDFTATIRHRPSSVRQLLLSLGTVGLWGSATLIMYWANRWLKYLVPFEAYGKRFRGFTAYHLLNLMLTVVTVGLWAMALRFMFRISRSGEQTVALSVDESCEVVRRPVV